MTDLRALTAVVLSGATLFGLLLALLTSLKPLLSKRLNLSSREADGLVMAAHLTLIPSTLACGLLVDTWGPRPVLIAGSCLTALGVVGLTLTARYTPTLALMLLLGLAAGAVGDASMVLLPEAFAPLPLPSAVQFGNVFFAVGALLAPLLAERLLLVVTFRRTLLLFALLSLTPAVLASLTPGERFAIQPPQQADLPHLFNEPILWLTVVLFLLYGPIEWTLANLTPRLLTDLGRPERQAVTLTTGFWLAFLGSRLALGLLQLPDWADRWLVLLGAMIATVTLGNLAGSSVRGSAGLGLIILGAALGPIFPALVSSLFYKLPFERGSAFGALFTFGSLGTVLAAPLVLGVARRHSVQYSLRIGLLLGILLTAVSLVTALLP